MGNQRTTCRSEGWADNEINRPGHTSGKATTKCRQLIPPPVWAVVLSQYGWWYRLHMLMGFVDCSHLSQMVVKGTPLESQTGCITNEGNPLHARNSPRVLVFSPGRDHSEDPISPGSPAEIEFAAHH